MYSKEKNWGVHVVQTEHGVNKIKVVGSIPSECIKEIVHPEMIILS